MPLEIEEACATQFGPTTVKPDWSLVSVKLPNVVYEWFQNYEHLSFLARFAEATRGQVAESLQELFRIVQVLPPQTLSIATIIRAGAAAVTQECNESDFFPRLQNNQRAQKRLADHLLLWRQRDYTHESTYSRQTNNHFNRY